MLPAALALLLSSGRAETGDTGCVPKDTSTVECDVDGDGYSSRYCCGPDCNDQDVRVNPDASEEVGDTADLNCDGVVWIGDQGPDPLYLSGGSGTCSTAPAGTALLGGTLLALTLAWRSRCAR